MHEHNADWNCYRVVARGKNKEARAKNEITTIEITHNEEQINLPS